MKTVLQINVTANSGSTGRIAEEIGKRVINEGWNSYIAYSRTSNASKSELIKIGSNIDVCVHGIESRLFDNHGLSSRRATRDFVEYIKREVKPDIIHLHNIHGYYINYELLFKYLKDADIPVVWTLHDCWSFTGHCCYFDKLGCTKWMIGCDNCPGLKKYPASQLLDNSANNFIHKKELFTSISHNLTLAPVSEWLGNFVRQSFFKSANIEVIHNGIDISMFKPQDNDVNHKVRKKINVPDKKIVLGVAAPWSERKGFNDFIQLRNLLHDDYAIIMVGLSDEQLSLLPKGVIGLQRTPNAQELAELYSAADVFVNPTYEDNYPTTNLESIACGTPVITYQTGGSPESITSETGSVVKQGDVLALKEAINSIIDKNINPQVCRDYAVEHFDSRKCFEKYITLYNRILNKK